VSPEERLRELGFELPPAPKPLGAYVPVLEGPEGLLLVSGMLPLREGGLICRGRVGAEVGLQEAQEAARWAVLNALAALKAHLAHLGKLRQCLRLTGYVASGEGFFEQPQVLNPASQLLAEVFGERGRHTRVAVGVAALPLGSPVEIELLFLRD